MKVAKIAVPTVTVIGYHPDHFLKVLVIKPVNKHGGRSVLVGGRLNLEKKESYLVAALREFDEEVGGKGAYLSNSVLWAMKTDPWTDMRESTLGKLTHEGCDSDVANTPLIGCYGCPDWIFCARVIGEPYPKDGEAKECHWVHARKLKITDTPEESEFGAQHDLYMGLYAAYRMGETHNQNLDFWLSDLGKLRESLKRNSLY